MIRDLGSNHYLNQSFFTETRRRLRRWARTFLTQIHVAKNFAILVWNVKKDVYIPLYMRSLSVKVTIQTNVRTTESGVTYNLSFPTIAKIHKVIFSRSLKCIMYERILKLIINNPRRLSAHFNSFLKLQVIPK